MEALYYCMIFQKMQKAHRNCTDHNKKSANEYENYPQKEKLETTNKELKQNWCDFAHWQLTD